MGLAYAVRADVSELQYYWYAEHVLCGSRSRIWQQKCQECQESLSG